MVSIQYLNSHSFGRLYYEFLECQNIITLLLKKMTVLQDEINIKLSKKCIKDKEKMIFGLNKMIADSEEFFDHIYHYKCLQEKTEMTFSNIKDNKKYKNIPIFKSCIKRYLKNIDDYSFLTHNEKTAIKIFISYIERIERIFNGK